jgi:hypothetical protein
MQETAGKSQKTNCIGGNALISLLTSYSKEDIHASFGDMDQMFKDWLLTGQADDTQTRQTFIYSLQIIQELGAIVKAIPAKKVKKLHAEMQELLNAANQA